MPHPIIAAVDPSREDSSPVALGALFARVTGEQLVIATTFPSVDGLYPEYARTMRLDAERAVRRAAALVDGPHGVEVTAVAATGSPAAALHELAADSDAAVVVIGTSRRGTLARALPDAVTDRLLHGAPCAVAVAPVGFSASEAAARPLRIGVGFTDTAEGHAALSAASRLAAQSGGVVHVLVVVEPVDLLIAGVVDHVALADARRGTEQRADEALRTGLDAVDADQRGGGQILSGHPAEALAAASAKVDLIVCGSRGYGPLRTLLAGSTSHALVRRAACPVLVVPRPQGPAPVIDDTTGQKLAFQVK